MPTVLGARFSDGVVIAGDKREVNDGRVLSDDLERVVGLENVAVGSAGSPRELEDLTRTVDKELRNYANRNERPVSAAAFERILASACQHANADCLGAVRTDDGHARLLRVDDDGGVMRDQTAAIGSGAAIASGQLETLETDQSTSDGADSLEQILSVVHDRDTETGSTIDSVIVGDQ